MLTEGFNHVAVLTNDTERLLPGSRRSRVRGVREESRRRAGREQPAGYARGTLFVEPDVVRGYGSTVSSDVRCSMPGVSRESSVRSSLSARIALACASGS